jgi:hypothetical protein
MSQGSHLGNEPSAIHGPLARGEDRGATVSSNWSGYVATGTTFTDVVASWTAPAVTCTGQAQYSSYWIGIDGYLPGDKKNVEQVGTDSDCTKTTGGKKHQHLGGPVYYAWWDMYPARTAEFSTGSCPVSPGDAMTAQVSSAVVTDSSGNTSTQYTLMLSDATQGWQCSSPPETSAAPATSAEWVVEAPFKVANKQILPLANFGSVGFSGAQANATPISGFTNDVIIMREGSTVEALPSPIGSDGASFTVTWEHQ